MTVAAILWIIGAYLFGSVPFGVLVGRLKGVDPRAAGSGNIGATNVLRLLGPGPGAAVLLLDILKGLLPVWLAAKTQVVLYTLSSAPPIPVYGRLGIAPVGPTMMVLVGIAAILGHSYSVFLRGKGGKSVATTGGVLFALDWRVGILALVVLVLAVALTRYVSVGSTAAAVSVPLGFGYLERGTSAFWPYLAFGTLAMLLVIYKHRANYQRLAAGTESKFGEKPAG